MRSRNKPRGKMANLLLVYLQNGARYTNKVDCLTTPSLAYPDHTKDFFLHVDASEKRRCAVLYQEREKVSRVIGYDSRTLCGAERN